MRSRNPVTAPTTRDLLLNLIVARGCREGGWENCGDGRIGLCFVAKNIFRKSVTGFGAPAGVNDRFAFGPLELISYRAAFVLSSASYLS